MMKNIFKFLGYSISLVFIGLSEAVSTNEYPVNIIVTLSVVASILFFFNGKLLLRGMYSSLPFVLYMLVYGFGNTYNSDLAHEVCYTALIVAVITIFAKFVGDMVGNKINQLNPQLH